MSIYYIRKGFLKSKGMIRRISIDVRPVNIGEIKKKVIMRKMLPGSIIYKVTYFIWDYRVKSYFSGTFNEKMITHGRLNNLRI